MVVLLACETREVVDDEMDDAADLQVRTLVSEAGFPLAERRVEIRIVVDLAWSTDAGMERLLGPAVALQGMRVEQIASSFREGQAPFLVAKIDGFDKAFVAEVANGIVVGVEVLFGQDSERADDGQRAAVSAIQLVHTVAIHDQLALFAARQIQIVHQRVARIVIVSVWPRALVSSVRTRVVEPSEEMALDRTERTRTY
jgi:hypothetical protein